jgi:hypothetical protein
LRKEEFPKREYDTFTLPAGVYDSLRVTIGEGTGRNWWCVVFPSLCIPAASEETKDVAAGAGFSDSLSGAITGEDATICTTTEAYENCNAKWAITIVLEELEDGTYVAIRRAIVGEGNQYKITLEENQIAFVVHSGGSVPQNCLGSYENWMGKVVACSIRKGDVFEVDLTPGNLAVAAIGKLVEEPSEESSETVSEESSEEEETSAEAESVVSETSVEQPIDNDTDYTGVVIVCIAVIVVSVGATVVVTVKRKK